MTSLECRAVGTVPEAQLEELTALLQGLAGCASLPFEQREVVLRAPAAAAAPDGAPPGWRPDLRLLQDLGPSTSGRTEPSSRWTALQFSLHLRGKQHAALLAVVRHVTRAECTGEGVPAFWQALGFAPRYQLLRRGQRFLVPLGGREVEVSLCRVLRLPPLGGSGTGGGSGGAAACPATLDAAALQQAAEVSPGHLLVEAVAAAPAEEDHMESVGAVTQLAGLLAPFTALQRPPRAPGEPL
ncbi:hypothetical protein ABPG75_006249 [Micractinium tetrahymenae]